MLEVKGLNVRYGKSHVIFDIDLRVGDGEVLALLGRNGAGKTTTLMGIVGLLPGASGQVIVSSRQVGGLPAYRRARAVRDALIAAQARRHSSRRFT